MTRKSCLLYLGVAVILPALLLSQSFTASVRGVVTDASQAAVPRAAVVLRDVDRNTEHATQTDAVGRYVVTALPPGNYTLTVEAAGFQRFTRSAFNLQVQQQATIDVELRVGEVATTVQVEGAAPLLNTTIANLGQVIENRYILSLPLIARNPYTLSYLAPGVVGSGGRYGEGNTNFVAAGTRNSTADVMLDGVSVTVPEQNSGITSIAQTPSVDAVQEFKVQTSFFSAEFGNSGGAVINMVTKSGANDFHGSGYWFFRDDALNANNFFSNRAGRRKPPYQRHLFGGSASGPLQKDKTFFFVNFERTREETVGTATATWPTLQQRQGDFSDYRTSAGQSIVIYNPFDTYTNAAGEIKRRPFTGNVVPRSMIHPIAAKAASYYPEPNQPGAAFTQVDNWFAQGVNPGLNSQMEIKVDHNFNDKNRLSARYSPRWSRFDRANLFGEGRPGPPWELKHTTVGANNAVLDWTRAHSPTTMFNVRFGLLLPWYYSTTLEPFDLTSLGLPKYMMDAQKELTPPLRFFPQFQPEGYTAIGDAGWTYIGREQGGPQIVGSMTRIMGGHNFKAGAEFRRNFLDYNQPGYPAGSFSFSRQITREDRFVGSATQGNGFASMLLGWGSGSRFDHAPWAYTRSQYYGLYVQDDWKLTRKLTINLGLRYDLERPHWEKEYRESYWNLNDPSPLDGKVPGYKLIGFYMFTDKDTPSASDGDHKSFGPRVGFAYALSDRTSIRSGYGLFYTLSRAVVRVTWARASTPGPRWSGAATPTSPSTPSSTTLTPTG